jgi:hypothetical protein
MSKKIYCEVIGYTLLPINKLSKYVSVYISKIRKSKLSICHFTRKHGIWCNKKAKYQIEIDVEYNYYFIAKLCTYHKNILFKKFIKFIPFIYIKTKYGYIHIEKKDKKEFCDFCGSNAKHFFEYLSNKYDYKVELHACKNCLLDYIKSYE